MSNLKGHNWMMQYRQHRRRVLQATSRVNSLPPCEELDVHLDSPLRCIERMIKLSGVHTRCKTSFTFSKRPNCTQRQRRSQRGGGDGGDENDNGSARAAKAGEEIGGTHNLKLDDIPEHVLQRYGSSAMLRNIRISLRPCIFVDLMVDNGQLLGRLILQLYTEACPEVVEEFVKTSSINDSQSFKVNRIMPELWLEAELALQNAESLTSSTVEHEMSVIDHGAVAGILSFPTRYVRGLCQRRTLVYTVNFKPTEGTSGRRVAFGRVRCGLKLLEKLREFKLLSSGKPVQEIKVWRCGVLKA